MKSLALILTLFLATTSANKCNSFENVEVLAVSKSGKQHVVEIFGCIERTAFNDTITIVSIQNQNIPRLGEDSVRHMKHLHTITIQRSGVRVIESTAFRNVPNLRIVKILNSDLEVVQNGVFNTEKMPHLKELYLTYNKINRVEDSAFAGLETLETLYCDHNELREWKKKWFVNSTNLVTLNFGYNQIRVIPRGAFESLLNLKVINFNYNELDVLESDAFKSLTHLDYLGLKHNRLKSIHPRVFPNSLVVKFMAINANYLNFISKKIMVSVNVRKTSLDGNPWKCPCLDEILLWLHETSATVEKTLCKRDDVPVCSFPSSFSRACRETVEEDVTRTFLEQLRKIEPPVDKNCARLD